MVNALENIKPIWEVEKVGIEGTIYDVSRTVARDRQQILAIRWILEAAFKRHISYWMLTERGELHAIDYFLKDGLYVKLSEGVVHGKCIYLCEEAIRRNERVQVVVDPSITIKAIGHQWCWTYEYSDYNSSDEQSLTFDSYMIPEDDLEGQLCSLEVDNRVVVPTKTHLYIIVTPVDVPHS
ncbi:hypothetical protein M9H77_31307 [Catharanthus roseus]|uniref:Uncharacterized protein n=1 Tax=Catharanthus roseus TaxID=4058 RepID=A0ACC0A0R8_CATRO|nr:hypothetical protein M9H77_31307 [Catharanthus roseus]